MPCSTSSTPPPARSLISTPTANKNSRRCAARCFAWRSARRPVTLYLLPTERGVEFRREVETAADVTLSGSALAFARLGGGGWDGWGAGGANDELSEGRVAIQGDAELGQALQKILGRLDLDWEELLSRWVGDTPARKLANAARGLAGWAEQSFGLSRENAADYLREGKTHPGHRPGPGAFRPNPQPHPRRR